MNKPVSVVLAICLLVSPVGASSVPIRELLTGSGGQVQLSSDVFLVSKRTSAGGALVLGVGHEQSDNGRISELNVLAFREYLSPAELDLFQRNVVRVTQTCFNLLPARAPAIAAWLAVQNAGTFRRASSTFGPMSLTFLRSVTDDGQFYTAVSMTRTRVPGEAPWTGWCTP